MSKNGLSTFGGALLVAGTAIGGGMLALPVIAGVGGFFPAVALCFISWVVMASTALLILEASLWMKGETNFVSIAEKTLGTWGKFAAWGLYIFLFYCLNVSYLSEGGEVVVTLLNSSVSSPVGIVLFTALFAPFVYYGASAVDRLNRIFISGLILSFLFFFFFGWSHVEVDRLYHRDWKPALLSLPIIFGSFGFQGLVPTLASNFNFDLQRSRKAILIGSFIPFVVYVVWLALVLGIVPVEGENGLKDSLEKSYSVAKPLKVFLSNPKIFLIAEFFEFFALITSFLGVSLAVFDFLADGLKIEKDRKGSMLLSLLVFAPPLTIALTYPGIFIDAQRYAAGFGVAILLGLMPILMVWNGRYRKGFQSDRRVVGGRAVLALMLLFICVELLCEFHHLFSKIG